MALKLLQPGTQPLGQFDGKDSEVLTLKGGEVVTFASTALSALDLAAYDSFDGYVNSLKRTFVTKAGRSGVRPLMLADDGISGYGTLFGTVVGGTVGQVSYGASSVVPASAQLGPHTATGSGKVTLWDKPGLYAVSLDAVDTAADGLVPSNATLDTGAALSFTSGGLLTPAASGQAVHATNDIVGRFVDFDNNGSLVTTPNKLISSLATSSFTFAVFYFNPPSA